MKFPIATNVPRCGLKKLKTLNPLMSKIILHILALLKCRLKICSRLISFKYIKLLSPIPFVGKSMTDTSEINSGVHVPPFKNCAQCATKQNQANFEFENNFYYV